MYLSLVLKSLLIGWINALPAGPAAVVCIRRTIVDGRRAGMLSGLGMALADSLYVIAARTGAGPLAHSVAASRSRVIPVSAIIAIAVGANIFRKANRPGDIRLWRRDGRSSLRSGFLLSLTNPLMLVSLPALFAALGLNESRFDPLGVAVTVVSVLGGSMVWWLIATGWLGHSRETIAEEFVRSTSKLLGIALIILGILSVSSLLV